jgi:predicted DNA-binding transcriptional regulator AlpA
MEPKTTGKRLLTVKEAAHYLGLSPRTIYNQICPKAKKPFPIQPKRIGGKALFDIRELDRLIDSL